MSADTCHRMIETQTPALAQMSGCNVPDHQECMPCAPYVKSTENEKQHVEVGMPKFDLGVSFSSSDEEEKLPGKKAKGVDGADGDTPCKNVRRLEELTRTSSPHTPSTLAGTTWHQHVDSASIFTSALSMEDRKTSGRLSLKKNKRASGCKEHISSETKNLSSSQARTCGGASTGQIITSPKNTSYNHAFRATVRTPPPEEKRGALHSSHMSSSFVRTPPREEKEGVCHSPPLFPSPKKEVGYEEIDADDDDIEDFDGITLDSIPKRLVDDSVVDICSSEEDEKVPSAERRDVDMRLGTFQQVRPPRQRLLNMTESIVTPTSGALGQKKVQKRLNFTPSPPIASDLTPPPPLQQPVHGQPEQTLVGITGKIIPLLNMDEKIKFSRRKRNDMPVQKGHRKKSAPEDGVPNIITATKSTPRKSSGRGKGKNKWKEAGKEWQKKWSAKKKRFQFRRTPEKGRGKAEKAEKGKKKVAKKKEEEKLERLEKKEQEKRERLEKKEMEKRKREEAKLRQKKEREEKKERDKRARQEKREQEKREKKARVGKRNEKENTMVRKNRKGKKKTSISGSQDKEQFSFVDSGGNRIVAEATLLFTDLPSQDPIYNVEDMAPFPVSPCDL